MSPELSHAWLSAFLLGVSLGITACAATCLPFIGTLMLGRADGRSAGLRDAAAFLGGRLLAYTLLGGLAGALGAWFVKGLAEGYGNLAIGGAALLSAVLLINDRRQAHRQCRRQAANARLSPLLLGVALTLIPCAPLASLLATAAGSESGWQGTSIGFFFGLGALLTPMLVLIPATASLARSLCVDQPWLKRLLPWFAAAVLLAIGTRRIALVSATAALIAAGIAVVLLIALARRRPATGTHPVFFHQRQID